MVHHFGVLAGLFLMTTGCAPAKPPVQSDAPQIDPFTGASVITPRTFAGGEARVRPAAMEAEPGEPESAAASPASTPGAPARPALPIAQAPAAYQRYDAFAAAAKDLVRAGGDRVRVESIAKSHAGREVLVITVAGPGDTDGDQRPAILIVGGIDGDHPGSSAAAMAVALRLVNGLSEDGGDVADMLAERTFYIIPRANPDGVERYFEQVKDASRLNARPIDQDRDIAIDEDGPNDLDGDGVISVMRVRDPQGEWMIDPDEPRLMRKAKREKNERGEFKLMLEGRDDDADGEIDEDPVGGVDHDRNWPHLFESGVLEAGIHPLSEPENRAIADFVIAHRNIAAAIVYGRNDNVAKVPKGRDRGPDGQSYRDLHPDDVPRYEFLSEKFKQITGVKDSAGCRPDGALYAWLYAQEGIPTFATSLWWPVEEKKPTTQPASQPATQAAEGDEGGTGEGEAAAGGEPGREDSDQPPDREAMRAAFRRQFGDRRPTRAEVQQLMAQFRGGGRRAGGGGPRGGGSSSGAAAGDAESSGDLLGARVEATKAGKGWLEYSDAKRDGEGFVEWHEVDHPTLGEVELGGMKPYFDTAPPPDALEEIAAKQVDFLVALSDLLPAPRFEAVEVAPVGAGLWRIKMRLTNDGYWPTNGGIADHIRLPGWAVRPRVDAERVVGGQRLERIGNLAGSGGAAELQWLIRGEEGGKVQFTAYHRVCGELKAEVELREMGVEK